MIKKLLAEIDCEKELSLLAPCQQEQYNNILKNIKNEKEEYIVAVDIGNNDFEDYTVIQKILYKDGKFHICSCEYVKNN